MVSDVVSIWPSELRTARVKSIGFGESLPASAWTDTRHEGCSRGNPVHAAQRHGRNRKWPRAVMEFEARIERGLKKDNEGRRQPSLPPAKISNTVLSRIIPSARSVNNPDPMV